MGRRTGFFLKESCISFKEVKTMKCFQVINNCGHPASNNFGDLCIFPSKEQAKAYKKYLEDEVYYRERFKIKSIEVLI